MFRADFLQNRPLGRLGVVPGWIIGVDQRNRARPRGNPLPQRRRVQMPAIVVKERVRDQPNIVQIGEKIEERIARLRNQHLVPRIAKQPKKVAVSLAGAGCQEEVLRIDRGSMPGIVAGHGFPRLQQAFRIRIVVQRRRGLQRTQNRLGIVCKPAPRRV